MSPRAPPQLVLVMVLVLVLLVLQVQVVVVMLLLLRSCSCRPSERSESLSRATDACSSIRWCC